MTTTNKNHDLISGELVLWDSAMTPKTALVEICNAHGVAANWTELTAYKALGLALRSLSDAARMVRPGKGSRYCVVHEVVDEDGNEYETQTQFEITSDWVVSLFEPRPPIRDRVNQDRVTEQVARVQAEVDTLRGMVESHCFTEGLWSIMLDEFKSTRVRSKGGAYFVGRRYRDRWQRFAKEITAKTGVVIYHIRSDVDADTASAIMATAKADLAKRYRDGLDALAKVNDGLRDAYEACKTPKEHNRVTKRVKEKRQAIMSELAEVEKVAEAVGESFGDVNNLATEIKTEVKAQMAIALLAN